MRGDANPLHFSAATHIMAFEMKLLEAAAQEVFLRMAVLVDERMLIEVVHLRCVH